MKDVEVGVSESERKRKGEAELLTKKQRELLALIYRFRFVTAPLIARYNRQTYSQTASERLNYLVSLGYLAKRYDGSYRLLHRPVEYYATTRCVKLFRTLIDDCSERELRRLYVRARASERFVHRSLVIFHIYLQLREIYDEQLHFSSKPELNIDEYDYFPHPLPDAFFTVRNQASRDNDRHFFLEYFDDAVSVGIHGRQISKYIRYLEEDAWDVTGLNNPEIVIVCQSESLRVRMQKRVNYLASRSDGSASKYIALRGLEDGLIV